MIQLLRPSGTPYFLGRCVLMYLLPLGSLCCLNQTDPCADGRDRTSGSSSPFILHSVGFLSHSSSLFLIRSLGKEIQWALTVCSFSIRNWCLLIFNQLHFASDQWAPWHAPPPHLLLHLRPLSHHTALFILREIVRRKSFMEVWSLTQYGCSTTGPLLLIDTAMVGMARWLGALSL